AKGAKDSRCEPRPGRPGDLLPGRPPSKAKRIRRVLCLRGPRVRTPPAAFSPAARRRRKLATRRLRGKKVSQSRHAESPAAPREGDLPPQSPFSSGGPVRRDQRQALGRGGVLSGVCR